METQARPPNLQTVWSEHESLSQFPRGAPYSARTAIYSPSVRSPNMPSPMYPRSPGLDRSMRRHERAMVDSLDQRGRRMPIETSDNRTGYRSLSPIAEANWDRRRTSFASVASPRAPAPTPVSPRMPAFQPRTQTLAAETRSILLSGAPTASHAAPVPAIVTTSASDRRRSLPSSLPSFRRDSVQERQELQAWGHVFYGNGTEANCFVTAVSLRRSSESSSGEDSPDTPGRMARPGNRVTIRARVRPCALGRKPFLLKREFDMDELRATVPLGRLSPVPAEPRRLSAELATPEGHHTQGRRRFSSGSDISSSPIRSSNTVPIREFPLSLNHIAKTHADFFLCKDLRYARAYLPVLAALIYSGHIKPRDIVDLPLPFPEVWPQTVAYVYTGQGELTDAMKQNIEYLGGKV